MKTAIIIIVIIFIVIFLLAKFTGSSTKDAISSGTGAASCCIVSLFQLFLFGISVMVLFWLFEIIFL
jgi:hypothetical protein